MTTATVQILNRLCAQFGADGYAASDYAVSKMLSTSRATVSHWRRGKGSMGEHNAITAAGLLDEDPGAFLLELLAERSEVPDARRIYRRIAAMLRESSGVDCHAEER